MSDYLPLRPAGLGTPEIESFNSYFARAAALHGLTIIQMGNHLNAWVDRRGLALGRIRPELMCENTGHAGIGDNVASLIAVLSQALGEPDLIRTTLLPLRPAIARFGQYAVKRVRHWCPACMEERLQALGFHYDSLVWATLALRRCPNHRLRLMTKCPHCAVEQWKYHRTGDAAVCWRCNQSLRCEGSRWLPDPVPAMGEKDCQELVAAIADGTLVRAETNALNRFYAEKELLLTTACESSTSIRRQRVSVLSRGGSPRLHTILVEAHESGVPALSILTDPRGAARLAGELECVRRTVPRQRRPRQAAEAVALVRARFRAELSSPAQQPIAPLHQICAECAVSEGFVRYRLREEVAAYVLARIRRCQSQLAQLQREVRQLLEELLHAYRRGQLRSYDAVVDEIVRRSPAGKCLARRELEQALRGPCGRIESGSEFEGTATQLGGAEH